MNEIYKEMKGLGYSTEAIVKAKLLKLEYDLNRQVNVSKRYEVFEEFRYELEELIEYLFSEREKTKKKDKKKIKQLEEENAILRKANNITKELTKKVKIEDITKVMNKSYEEFMKQFIPKQKVKDKIKELKERIEKLKAHKEDKYSVNYINAEYLLDKIEKSLLEDK